MYVSVLKRGGVNEEKQVANVLFYNFFISLPGKTYGQKQIRKGFNNDKGKVSFDENNFAFHHLELSISIQY